MKGTLLIITAVFITFSAIGQTVTETVSLGSGYQNQVWYSMEHGEKKSQTKSDWDIAFEAEGFSASILINSPNGVKLWIYPGPNSDFATMDTTGMASWKELHNSDTSWAHGAFNRSGGGLDLGWGTYDPITHIVSGDSIYLIQLANGEYRKFEIEELVGGTYNFRQASLDNSLNASHSLSKSQFTGRNFAYFSLENQTLIDREPYNGSWDILFTQYTSVLFIPAPVPYTVSGVLSNLGTEVAEAYPVDVATYADYNSLTFNDQKNGIGYDWKSFTGTAWALQDSLVYFVRTSEGDVWKLVFTAFGGSADGNFTFTKEQLYISGLEKDQSLFVNAYPNPATDRLNFIFEGNDASVSLINTKGEIVKEEEFRNSGFRVNTLDVQGLETGFYILNIRVGEKTATRKILIK